MSDAQKAVHLGHPVKHTLGFLGMLLGGLLGAALGILAALTFGLGAIAVIGAACAGASILGGLGMSLGSGKGITTGLIVMPCAIDVLSEGKPAAHTTSLVGCGGTVPFFSHGGATIAEGSQTVLVNGKYAARVNSRATCGAIAGGGCSSVIIGGPTVQVAPIKSDIPKWAGTFLKVLGMVGGFLLAFATGGWLLGIMDLALGEIVGLAADYLLDLFFEYICTSEECQKIFAIVMAGIALLGVYASLKSIASKGNTLQDDNSPEEPDNTQQSTENSDQTPQNHNDEPTQKPVENPTPEEPDTSPSPTAPESDNVLDDTAKDNPPTQPESPTVPDNKPDFIDGIEETGKEPLVLPDEPQQPIQITDEDLEFAAWPDHLFEKPEAEGNMFKPSAEFMEKDGAWYRVDNDDYDNGFGQTFGDWKDAEPEGFKINEIVSANGKLYGDTEYIVNPSTPKNADTFTIFGQDVNYEFLGHDGIVKESSIGTNLLSGEHGFGGNYYKAIHGEAYFLRANTQFISSDGSVSTLTGSLGSVGFNAGAGVNLGNKGLTGRAGADASVSLINIDYEAETWGANLFAGGEAKADIGGALGKGEKGVNAYLDGNLGAFAGAKLEGYKEFSFLNDYIKVTPEGYVAYGAGANAAFEAGLKNGSFTTGAKAGAALGLGAGAGVSVEVDIQQMGIDAWNATEGVRGSISDGINKAGEALNNAGEALSDWGDNAIDTISGWNPFLD